LVADRLDTNTSTDIGLDPLKSQLSQTLALWAPDQGTGKDSSKPCHVTAGLDTAHRELAQLNGSGTANGSGAKTETAADDHIALKEGISEFASSLSAGVVGTVVLSVSAAYLTHNYRALTVPMAMAAGAVTKYGVKGAGEHLLLDEKDRTLSAKDLAWGSVDALAGIGASMAEGKIANRMFTNIGREALGSHVAASTAFDAGKMMAKESLMYGLKTNITRGIVGGATGAGIWAAPHRLVDNWQDISRDPLSGLTKTGYDVGEDMLKGGLFGGVLGLGGTLIGRHNEVMGRVKAAINPEKNVYRVDTYHINDFHSNTEQLPRLKTLLDLRMKASAGHGTDTRFVVPGDIESGRVNFAFTKGGEIENKAIVAMGAKEIVPGNHPYDAPGGRFDIPRYPAMMGPILKNNPDVSLISANLDVSAYPDFSKILKPYAVREVITPWGPTKLGTIGLTTEEGALGQIKYNDPLETVISTVAKLRAEGVTIFQIHSHLGLGEDIKLAQNLIANNVKVSGIIGAHSHDALPRPYWVASPSANLNLAAKLPLVNLAKNGAYEIPIVQAGHSGNWLGEFHQEILPDGTSVRYQTSSRLHQVTPEISEDPTIRKFLDDNVGAINNLKSETYDSRAIKPYSVANSRNRETPIANLYADALYNGLKTRLGDDAPDMVLVHSGGIRSGLPANQELSRLDLANIVMNAGNVEGEKTELALMNLTGAQLKDALEYGVRERIADPKPSLMEQVKGLFTHQREVLVDEPGNFTQVSDRLKYTYDASKAPIAEAGGGQRIVDIQFKNAQGQFEPLDPTRTYKVAARFHPLDKWTKFKLFGDKTIEQVHQELGVQPLKFSQVDLIAEHIRGKTLDPGVHGAVTGRVTDLTPKVSAPSLRPGKSLFVAPVMSGFESMDQTNK